MKTKNPPTPHRNDFPSGLAAPARRALAGAGIEQLEQRVAFREAEIAALHGVGIHALTMLRRALAERGLAFASDPLE